MLEDYLRAGRDGPADVAALQGELLVLRAVLREKEARVMELEAGATG